MACFQQQNARRRTRYGRHLLAVLHGEHRSRRRPLERIPGHQPHPLRSRLEEGRHPPQTRFFGDVQERKLPAVSWVTPTCQNSDHAGLRLEPRAGVGGLARQRDRESPYWESTAIFIMWDDYGGWYDHVPPPLADYDGLGIRVPLLVVSPYAKTRLRLARSVRARQHSEVHRGPVRPARASPKPTCARRRLKRTASTSPSRRARSRRFRPLVDQRTSRSEPLDLRPPDNE